MFCRNCGKEVITGGEYCISCGARPLAGNAFCPACAASTTPLSEICVKCGSRLLSAHPTAADRHPNPKSKTAAILLAVFLSFWTWLYTYRRDAWKFWTGLAVNLVLIGVWAWMLVNLMSDSLNGSFNPILDAFIVSFVVFYGVLLAGTWGITIWAIVDTAIKNQNWYDRYPG